MVGVDDVVSARRVQVARHGSPLACDTDTTTQEQIDRDAARHEAAAHRLAWTGLFQ